MQSLDFVTRYKAIRNSSSGFIKRANIRAYIFERDDYACRGCGCKEKLTVDHILSVYMAAKGKFPLSQLNTADNLQTLCSTCNERKIP